MNDVVMVNREDSWIWKRKYFLWFGACGPTRLMVWAEHLDAAFDTCIDWIEENAPGLLCEEQVQSEFSRFVAEGKSEEEAWTLAEVDTTCGGNHGLHVHSWEWGIDAENPDRAETLRLLGRT